MTQPHTRSATFDPADYRVVATFDGHDSIGGFTELDDDLSTGEYNWSLGTIEPTPEFEAEFSSVPWKCAHCGRTSGMLVVFYARYLPTGELVMVGSGCVRDLLASDRESLRAIEYGKAAKVRAAREEWEAANPEQAAALDIYEEEREAGGEYDRFLEDLVRARRLYGALTEGQTPWPTTAMAVRVEIAEREAEKAARLADVPPLAEGRRPIAGRIVSTKWAESDFGDTLKMLVEEEDGNRVYGTVPRVLSEAALSTRSWDEDGTYHETPAKIAALEGTKVSFAAAVERSRNDEHFGYYKRPTKVAWTEGEGR